MIDKQLQELRYLLECMERQLLIATGDPVDELDKQAQINAIRNAYALLDESIGKVDDISDMVS